MKSIYIYIGLIGVLLLVIFVSSCGRGRRNYHQSNEQTSPKQEVINNVNIINSTTNKTYNQQQYQYITVQNIDNSRIEYVKNVVNNISQKVQYVTINNNNVSITVDNSSQNENYVSQQLVQSIMRKPSSGVSRGGRQGSRSNYQRNTSTFNEGDEVEINNLNIEGLVIGGISAIVNNYQTQNADIVLSQETYQMLLQKIDNAIASNVSDNNFSSDEMEKYIGQGTGGFGVLAFIGLIVVVIFVVVIISWFK